MLTKFFRGFFNMVYSIFKLFPQSLEQVFIIPKSLGFLSKIFITLIVIAAGIPYVKQLLRQPLEDVTGIILTTFGAIAGLSALCYTAVPYYKQEQKETTLYAGEKFLHSCLMIIQTLFLKFAVDRLPELDILKNSKWLKHIQGFADFILVLFGIVAIILAYAGFYDLNNILWKRYEITRKKRYRNSIQEIRKRSP
jgi:hypothetical protein